MSSKYSPLSLEAALLGDARFWRDDRKTWQRKKRRPDGSIRVSRPRTPAEDRTLQSRYVELLERYAKRDTRAKMLVSQLDACRRRHPCGNAACPACLGAFQHGLVDVIARFLKDDHPPTGGVFAVSLIPIDEMVDFADLESIDLQNFRRRGRERLQPVASACEWMLLGIDLSLNVDEDERWGPKWSPHLYGIVRTNLSREDLKTELKKGFPTNRPFVRRPIEVKPLSPSRYALSYVLKTDFKRRISYPHSLGDRTKKADLRNGPEAEIQRVLVWLSQTRICDRLLLIGLKTIRSKSGVKIVPIATARSCGRPYRHNSKKRAPRGTK